MLKKKMDLRVTHGRYFAPPHAQGELATLTETLATRNKEAASIDERLASARQDLSTAQAKLAEIRQQLANPPASAPSQPAR